MNGKLSNVWGKLTASGFQYLLFFSVLPFTVFTQESCADDYPFGRVFTTQKQRELLDTNREMLLKGESVAEISPAELQVNESNADELILSGLLIRADGKTQVWVNGESELTDNKTTHGRFGLREKALADKSVRLKYHDKYRTMRPGQVWMIDEGVVKELHEIKSAKQDARHKGSIKYETHSKVEVPDKETRYNAVPDQNSQSEKIQQAIEILHSFRAQ